VLANHLAWVLERQVPPINWWGTAQNLQESATTDLSYARRVALDGLVPKYTTDQDVALLYQALRSEDSA
jgi:hypothetical protein